MKRTSLISASIGVAMLMVGCTKATSDQTTLQSDDTPAGFVTVSLDSTGAVTSGDTSQATASPQYLAIYADQNTTFNLKTFYSDVATVTPVHGTVDDQFNYTPGELGVFDDENCHIDAFQALQANDSTSGAEQQDLAGVDCLMVQSSSGTTSYVMIALTPADTTGLGLADDAYDHHLAVKMYAQAFGGAGNGGDLVMGPAVNQESDCKFGVGVAGGLEANVYGACTYTWQSSRSTAFSNVTFTKIGVQASIFKIPALPLYAVMITTDDGTRVRGPVNCVSVVGAMAFGSAMTTTSMPWDCNATPANRAVKNVLWNEWL